MLLWHTQKGITLLEILLTLVIAATVTTLSIRIYKTLQNQTYIQDTQSNIDALFDAMRNYYSAICYGNYDSTGTTFSPGTLNPANASAASLSDPTPVALSTLQSNGFFTGKFQFTPWVSGGTSGYVLQFNPTPVQSVTVNACTSSTACTTTSSTTAPSTAVALLYTIQVSILLPASYNATIYQHILGADCISSAGSVNGGTYVYPCNSASRTAGSYLVWQRIPSYATQHGTSPLWQSMPALKQFNLQYSHDQMGELMGTYNAYYLCGG